MHSKVKWLFAIRLKSINLLILLVHWQTQICAEEMCVFFAFCIHDSSNQTSGFDLAGVSESIEHNEDQHHQVETINNNPNVFDAKKSEWEKSEKKNNLSIRACAESKPVFVSIPIVLNFFFRSSSLNGAHSSGIFEMNGRGIVTFISKQICCPVEDSS